MTEFSVHKIHTWSGNFLNTINLNKNTIEGQDPLFGMQVKWSDIEGRISDRRRRAAAAGPKTTAYLEKKYID